MNSDLHKKLAERKWPDNTRIERGKITIYDELYMYM